MQTLIQIPALGCDAQLYNTLHPHLAQNIDQRIIVTIADRMAGCVAQVLEKAPKSFVIQGTSFGGRVAMETVLAVPERAKGLIIIGSGPGAVADQIFALKRSERMRGGEFETVLQEMADSISHLPGPNGNATMHAFRNMARRMGPENMALQSDALAYRQDLWPRLAEIECPVLCLWGEQDQYVEGQIGRKIAAEVKNGTYIELPDCGHFPSLEYPKETADAIASWLSSNALI